jgi:HSP20 family molecular chaperone IbpA
MFDHYQEHQMNTYSRSAFIDFNTLLNHRRTKNRYTSPTAATATRAVSEGENLRVDISDCGDTLQLIAEMPGIDKSDILVSVDESVLTIEGKRPAAEDAAEGTSAIRSERYLGDLKRSFTLGDDIDKDGISAQFENGLLILTVLKQKEVIQQPT